MTHSCLYLACGQTPYPTGVNLVNVRTTLGYCNHVRGLSERPGHDARFDVHPLQISRLDIAGLELWTRVVAQADDVLAGFRLAGHLPGGVFSKFLPATCLISAWR